MRPQVRSLQEPYLLHHPAIHISAPFLIWPAHPLGQRPAAFHAFVCSASRQLSFCNPLFKLPGQNADTFDFVPVPTVHLARQTAIITIISAKAPRQKRQCILDPHFGICRGSDSADFNQRHHIRETNKARLNYSWHVLSIMHTAAIQKTPIFVIRSSCNHVATMSAQ